MHEHDDSRGAPATGAEGTSPDPDRVALPRGRVVPPWAVQVRATTSGGPGGQHANRSSTRVELRLHLDALASVLEPREVELLRARLATRTTQAGEVVVQCGDHRSQLRNRKGAAERMEELLAAALEPRRRRVPTRASAGARRRRLEAKRQQSARKRERGWQPGDDD